MSLLLKPDGYDLISIKGAKAADFLQGQLSCNVPDATPGRLIPGAYCTPKGRVICNFMLARIAEDHFVIRVHNSVSEPCSTTLHKYGVFSRVSIDTNIERITLLAVSGMEATELDTLLVAHQNIIARSAARNRLTELWVSANEEDRLIADLDARCETGSAADWARALIDAGLAEITAPTTDTYLPNMLGYTNDGTVHFRKGCYTGQEIIARAHYRGAVKRQLARVDGDGTAPPPGTDLCAMDGGKTIGEILQSAPATTACRWAALAVVNETASASPLCVSGGSSVEISVL